MQPNLTRRAAMLAATVLDNPWIPKRPPTFGPFPKQATFLSLVCEEAMFGGAAGGSKSDALLQAALQFVDVPGYRALLLRRTFKQLALPGAMMDRAASWLRGSAARWSESDKTWTFPSGATLTFGHIENEADRYNYQGAEFAFIGFDELTQFTEVQYTYLHSRLRAPKEWLERTGVPLRIRSATNPGGIGHRWVKARFIESETRGARVFVPSKLADNLAMDQVAYRRTLQALDPVTRRQLEDGDWDVQNEGEMFQRSKFVILPRAKLPDEYNGLVRCWDFAATEPSESNKDPDWTRGQLWGWRDGMPYLLDQQSCRKRQAEVDALVDKTAEADGKQVAIVLPIDPGSAGKGMYAHFCARLSGHAVYGYRPTGDKVVMARPVSASVDNGHVTLCDGPWVQPFLDEVCLFPTKGVHDDQVDPMSMAWVYGPYVARKNMGNLVRVGAQDRITIERRDPVRLDR